MIRTRVVSWTILALLVASWAWSQPDGRESARHNPFTILETRVDGWRVEYRRYGVDAGTVTIDRVPHLLFAGATHPSSSREGDPGLPVEAKSFGIPFDAHLEVSLEQPEFHIENNQSVAPVPTLEGSDEIHRVGVYRKNPAAYTINRFVPEQSVLADEPFTLREQRIATVRLAPVRFNPATGTLQTLQRAILNIRLVRSSNAGTAVSSSPTSPDPHFEPVYSMLLANYEQAKEWRRGHTALTPMLQDSTRAWFRTGVPYLKLGITRDGWYRVSRDDIRRALGMDPGLTSCAIFNRGRSVPILVRGDSAAEFYACRKYGDSSYADEYTDTNAYWLSWEPGLRYQPSGWQGTSSDTITTATVTHHFEENRAFYVGTLEQEIISNAPVPGRGWVWEFYYPGTSAAHDFFLDTVDRTAPALLKMRLQSTTLHYNTPDHRARFWINDSLVGEVSFDGRQTALVSATLAGGLLRSGKNSLRIVSVPTASSPNQFALEWFEVSHSRPLVAANGYLHFTMPGGGGANGRVFAVSGFTSGDAEVYDVSTGRRFEAVTVLPGGNSRIVFADTASSDREYVVLAPGTAASPDRVRRREFVDHRANARGADYIVITHRQFLSPARELAVHRERTNGVRTAVIDVEDLYDEFNFGLKHPGAMKEFLRYALEHWRTPAPSNLLLYGDACHDDRGYDPTTTKIDYVPSYGHPTGDNWFVCFDPGRPFLPSLLVGRLPIEDSAQGRRVNAKIIGYDGYEPAAWSKEWLFITGGNSDAEQASFDAATSRLADMYVAPAPVGGSVNRVAKATATVIDGDSRESIKDLIREGLVFVNFLGHSGGRIWNVDVGNPSEFENTNGRLPFVTSVSCNVGAFASAFQNCLAEDFLYAENRGAVAVWGSSSLGYAGPGTSMVEFFLSRLAADTVRSLGALTTAARYYLWTLYGTGAVIVAHMNLTPLVGDPLTRIALPLRPDLAVSEDGFSLERQDIVAGDSAATIKVRVHNYGLVPQDSVDLEVTGLWGTSPPETILRNRLPNVYLVDSVTTRWDPGKRPGKHTLRVSVDPQGKIEEISKSNNSAQVQPYVYVGNLLLVRPMDNTEVPAGTQNLMVALPSARDAGSWTVSFELDTTARFDSPWRVRSGPVSPGQVSVQWATPVLPPGRLYFWRARADGGIALGSWVNGRFRTVPMVQPAPYLRWEQSERVQFQRNTYTGVTPSDSGVVVGAGPPVRLRARSLGERSTTNGEHFSSLSINDQTTLGYWWALGYGFMVVRVNPFTAAYELRGYSVVYEPARADSMAAFIENTPEGFYLAIAVVIDGRSNMNERLFRALESIGSSLIRQIKPGDSWTLITRKGQGLPGLPTERWSKDGTAEDSAEVPIRYPSGSMVTPVFLPAVRWKTFGWDRTAHDATGSIRLALIGHRRTGGVDTVKVSDGLTDSLDLRSLDAASLSSLYTGLSAAAFLSTSDPLRSPLLRRWWIDYEPPADLAISTKTVNFETLPARAEGTLTARVSIHNIGFRESSAGVCEVALKDQNGVARTLATVVVSAIAPDSWKEISLNLSGSGLPPRAIIRTSVTPGGDGVDLLSDNNAVELLYETENPLQGRIQILADGAELLDGDYIASTPRMSIRVPRRNGSVRRSIELQLDGSSIGLQTFMYGTSTVSGSAEDVELNPTLPVGTHQLSVTVVDAYTLGAPDSSQRQVLLKVSDELRIVNLLNYPNPFARGTEFTFSLAGPRAPDQAVLRIYTIAGRKIHEIGLGAGDTRIGFNRIEWDGRDSDGDEIANGIYLYKLEIRLGESSVAELGKLAKLR